MSLDVKLTQNISQRLILTPQMIMSMRLLNLPLLELKNYLENQIIENPLLEIDTSDTPANEKTAEPEEPAADNSLPNEELDVKEQFDIINRMDKDWQENFFKNINPADDIDRERKRDYRLSLITKPHNLYDHLIEQLVLVDLTPKEHIVAENIIGNIDDNGYLQANLEEIAQASQTDVAKVEEILSVIQQLDPPGVGARDLRETLLIQLKYLGKEDSLSYRIIQNNFDDFHKRKLEKLAHHFNVDTDKLNQAVQIICRLEPKPGRLFGEIKPQLIIPDIILEKRENEYTVVLNNDEIPNLKLNKYYRALIKQENIAPETVEFLKEKFKTALGLIRGIAQRQSTILKIANEIVVHQKDFFEKGRDYLKPLTLKEVAQKIGMHESTVSRAIHNKYIQTNQGLICMKELFNNRFKDKQGHYQSQVSVKEKIIDLIKQEGDSCPLTDDNLVQLLSKEGINIARRTVAKYRNAAGLLTSNLRKSS